MWIKYLQEEEIVNRLSTTWG